MVCTNYKEEKPFPYDVWNGKIVLGWSVISVENNIIIGTCTGEK